MALVDVRHTGQDLTGRATVVVDGSLSVLSADFSGIERPAQAGTALVEALNDALSRAEKDVEARVASGSLLTPALRAALEDGELHADEDRPVAELMRSFEGASDDGEVVIAVDARTRRATACYLQDVKPETLALIPVAANRALASAQTGKDGATPLEETLSKAEGRFEADLAVLEDRIAAVDEQLDEILRQLG